MQRYFSRIQTKIRRELSRVIGVKTRNRVMRRVIRTIGVNKSRRAIYRLLALCLFLWSFFQEDRSFQFCVFIWLERCAAARRIRYHERHRDRSSSGAADASLFIAHQSAILVPCASLNASFLPSLCFSSATILDERLAKTVTVSIIKFQFLDEEEKKRRKISASINYVDNNFQIEESEEREMCRLDELKIIARLR